MRYIKLYDQYSHMDGLESKPFSQCNEVKSLLDIDYPLFHKTPFIKNVPRILTSGIKRIPNKLLHYIGLGGNPLNGISFTNSFKLVKSKWKGDVTFIFDKSDIVREYGDKFKLIFESGESEELLVGVNHLDSKFIKAIMFSDNIDINDVIKIKDKYKVIALYQTKENTVILID